MSSQPHAQPRLYLVTGSTPEAETQDRPEAYRLRDAISDLLSADFPDVERRPIVCGDLWYLNQDHLRAEPALAVGPPQSNALTAFLADRLPSLRVVDGRWIVQGNPDFNPPVGACWGATPHFTRAAVDVFLAEYAAAFLAAVCDGDSEE